MKSPKKKTGKLIPWGGFLACYLMTLITTMILLVSYRGILTESVRELLYVAGHGNSPETLLMTGLN